MIGSIALLAMTLQAADSTYDRLVAEATTDPRFLPASVATLPAAEGIPSPLEHFGSIIGAEGIMHRTSDIYAYYRALADATDRMTVTTVATSEGGREILLAVIADPAVLQDIETLRTDMAALADPRTTTRSVMEEIVERAKPVYYIQAGLHSPEMGPPEMVLELAYRLVASEDEMIRHIRQNVVTIINPVAEPDGRDRQVDWYYRYTRGREELRDGFPRSSPFWGEYVYHDNNRDGLQLSQALTNAVNDVYFEWHPVVMHDLHESVPLLYVSTGTGPYNRTVDPITITEWQTMANWDVQTLTQQGAPGTWSWGFYDGWWPGYALWISINHNAIGRFYETFGNSGADTYLRDLRGSRYAGDSVTTQQWYRPWPPTAKVLWSLRNNTNYMQAGVLASLDFTARNRRELLRNFWQKSLNSMQRGIDASPHAFVIPPLDEQRDPRRAAYLVNQLMRHGIEVHRATDTLSGSYVVLLNQPYRDFAVNLLTSQEYPSAARYPPYDDIAWTLGYMYGVEVEAVDDRAALDWEGLVELTDTVAYFGTAVGGGGGGGDGRGTWLLRYTAQAELLPALYALRERDRRVTVTIAEQSFESTDTSWAVGTVEFDGLRARDAAWLAETYGLDLTAGYAGDIARHEIDLPRLAIYHTWFSTQANGWVRYWFDQLNIPYDLIDKDDLRRGRLRRSYDLILVPHGGGGSNRWIHGIERRWGPLPYTTTDEYPSHGSPLATDDLTGGPGFEGMANLQEFLDQGGTLITLANGARMAVETGLVPELSSHSAGGLFHPGSIVRAKARRPDNPIMYGFPENTHVFRGNGPLWRTAMRDRGTIVLQYGTRPLRDERDTVVTDIMGMPAVAEDSTSAEQPDDEANGQDENGEAQRGPRGRAAGDYVLSGMVRNSNQIIGHGAIFDVPAGLERTGRVVVFTFNPLHRYLNHHDAPFVFNAIMNWNDR